MDIKVKIINWIRAQLKKTGAKGIVLGFSGGIDSSVVAALSVKAVGKKKVLALILPIHGQASGLKDAYLVAKKLKVSTETLDLSQSYDQLIKILPRASRLTQGNLKPRLRMTVLYYFANKLNYLVCGTGNKSELMVGYFTKHGDGATDILPIGDLLKTEVKELAKKLGIPRHIIAKPPTAGFWRGQTDEAELGITYKDLDDILWRLRKNRKQKASRDKVKKVKAMIKRSEHKRQGPKICYIK